MGASNLHKRGFIFGHFMETGRLLMYDAHCIINACLLTNLGSLYIGELTK